MGEIKQFEKAELLVLLRELQAILDSNIPGDIVELGCYKGETSIHIARLIKDSGRRLYLYDSFEGLPDKSPQDQSPAGLQFKLGELPAAKKDVIRRMNSSGLKNFKVTKAWFSDLSSVELPDTVAFAFLDGDFYQSIHDSLKLVWPKLNPGATVVVDDYRNEALPGAARAVDDWLRQHPAKPFSIEKSLAIIHV